MLKYNNQEQTVILDTETGQTTTKGHWGYEAWLTPRLNSGETIEPLLSSEDKLMIIKSTKQQELIQAYKAADDAPYTIGDITYAGGINSSMMLEKSETIAIRLGRKNAKAYDIYLNEIVIPVSSPAFPDIKDVVESIALRSETYIFRLNMLLRTLMAATSEEDVDAIRW